MFHLKSEVNIIPKYLYSGTLISSWGPILYFYVKGVFFLVIVIQTDFTGFSDIWHLLHHCRTLFKLVLRSNWLFKDSILLYNTQASANNLSGTVTSVGKSLLKIRNKRGPKHCLEVLQTKLFWTWIYFIYFDILLTKVEVGSKPLSDVWISKYFIHF